MHARLASVVGCVLLVCTLGAAQDRRIGDESAIARHLRNGEEQTLPLVALVEHGRLLFEANWTEDDGAGRPLMTGAGAALDAAATPLRGTRGFNRVSGPDANSCRGCHNEPYGMAGGSGDFVTSGFELGERFEFATFNRRAVTSGADASVPPSLGAAANPRATPGLFGAGYLEMLARQMSEDLQRARDSIRPGQAKPLASKGVSFGVLARNADGSWDVSAVAGLPPQSLLIATPSAKPSLLVRPWRQSGSVVSLREFTNTSFHRHMGMQSAERFGTEGDPDGDGVAGEITRADVTAVVLFQATLPVPGRVIPNDPAVERAIATGERVFADIRCTACHAPSLRLNRKGWIYAEPGPFNGPGNLHGGETRAVEVDLTSKALPQPRLAPGPGTDFIDVPAFTDLKLHDITDAADPLAGDPFDMNQPPGTPAFAAGNRKFLTARLWGAANQSPYFHHGQFSTMRQAILAHAGEALEQRRAFEALGRDRQDALIEFLKSLQVLPPSTTALVVDEHGQPKRWPRD